VIDTTHPQCRSRDTAWQGINRAIAADPASHCSQAAAAGIEAARVSPQLQEHVLKDVLRSTVSVNTRSATETQWKNSDRTKPPSRPGRERIADTNPLSGETTFASGLGKRVSLPYFLKYGCARTTGWSGAVPPLTTRP